ncbi:MAG: TraR/DksA family transcriptional regulator [Anaerolineae bacterium]
MAQDEKHPYDQQFLDEMKQTLTQAKEWMAQGIAVGDREIIDYIGGVNAGIDQHPADDASAVFEQTLALTLRNMLSGTLTEVSDALVAINEGTYGRCEVCGSWIDPARLRALPFTYLCFMCAARKSRDFQPPTY